MPTERHDTPDSHPADSPQRITPHNAKLLLLLRVAMAVFVVAEFLALFHLTPKPAVGIKILLYNWAGALFTAVLLLGTWFGRGGLRRPHLLIWLAAAFVALNFVAAVASEHVGHSLAEWRKFLSLFLLAWVASEAYRTIGQVKRLIMVVCATASVASIYGFCQHFRLDPFPWADRTAEQYTNLPATFGNPNLASHVLVLALALTVYLASQKGTHWCVVFAPILATHLYLTHCRAGILALAAGGGLVGLALVTGRLLKKPGRAAFVSLLLSVAVAIALLSGIATGHMAAKSRIGPLDTSLLLRYNSYLSACRMITARPLLGVGPGNYKIDNTPFWTRFEERYLAENRSMNENTHQDLLECAADGGLFSAGLYLALLIAGMYCGLRAGLSSADPRARRLGYAFAAFFAVFLTDGFFGFNLRAPASATLLFVMIGTLAGVSNRALALETVRGRGPGRLAWRVTVLSLVFASATFDTRVFVSSYHLQRGRGAMFWEDYAEADQQLAKAEGLAPWNWRIPHARGLNSRKQGQHREAIEHFKHAVEANPHDVASSLSIAESYLALANETVAQTGRLEPAQESLASTIAWAERTLGLCAYLPEAEAVVGRAAYMLAAQLEADIATGEGNPEVLAEVRQKAESHLAKAVRYSLAGKGELLEMLANVRAAAGKWRAAESAFVSAVRAEPADELLWTSFRAFADRQGRYVRLQRELERHIAALEESPGANADALITASLHLAHVYANGQRDVKAAQTAYLRAAPYAAQRADYWVAFSNFARTFGAQEAFRESILGARNRARLQGAALLPAVQAVATYVEQGSSGLKDASHILLEAFLLRAETATEYELEVEFGWAASLLLIQLQSVGPQAQGADIALFNVGCVFMGLGERDTAEVLFKVSHPFLSPDLKAQAALQRADILIEAGRAEEAADFLGRALYQTPANVELRLMLARALARMGDKPRANAEYMGVLDMLPQDSPLRNYVHQQWQAQ